MEERIKHGTRYGYARQGCRCNECRAAQRDYMHEYKGYERSYGKIGTGVMPERAHGSRSGYEYWKCRCDECRKSNDDYNASRRSQRN